MATAPASAPLSGACAFCGEPGHFGRECEAVAEYTKAGKRKRNAGGKVVLPSRAMAPRWITRVYLHDCMDEWHRRNPGQEATSLLCSLAPGPGVIHLPEPLRSNSPKQNPSSHRSGAALWAQSNTPSHMAQLLSWAKSTSILRIDQSLHTPSLPPPSPSRPRAHPMNRSRTREVQGCLSTALPPQDTAPHVLHRPRKKCMNACWRPPSPLRSGNCFP